MDRETFRQIDKTVTRELLRLCQQRHPTWNDKKIKKKCFYIDDKDRYRDTLEGHMNYQAKQTRRCNIHQTWKIRSQVQPLLKPRISKVKGKTKRNQKCNREGQTDIEQPGRKMCNMRQTNTSWPIPRYTKEG